MTLDPAIFDDRFHAAAFHAFVEVATKTGGPPDRETTKYLAFRYYEEALAEKNASARPNP